MSVKQTLFLPSDSHWLGEWHGATNSTSMCDGSQPLAPFSAHRGILEDNILPLSPSFQSPQPPGYSNLWISLALRLKKTFQGCTVLIFCNTQILLTQLPLLNDSLCFSIWGTCMYPWGRVNEGEGMSVPWSTGCHRVNAVSFGNTDFAWNLVVG
jgi:hypothetical protein